MQSHSTCSPRIGLGEPIHEDVMEEVRAIIHIATDVSDYLTVMEPLNLIFKKGIKTGS
jgi:hypothetical protein